MLIRRLASDVVAADDVVAAWQEVEALHQELRRKDGELAAAMEALAAAQAFGESPGAAARHHETAGQQLARFLKDQLAARDAQLEALSSEGEEARRLAEERGAALAASEARCGELQAQLEAAQGALQSAQGGCYRGAHRHCYFGSTGVLMLVLIWVMWVLPYAGSWRCSGHCNRLTSGTMCTDASGNILVCIAHLWHSDIYSCQSRISCMLLYAICSRSR